MPGQGQEKRVKYGLSSNPVDSRQTPREIGGHAPSVGGDA